MIQEETLQKSKQTKGYNVLLLLGGIFGIFNILLSFIFPSLLGWYRIRIESLISLVYAEGYITGIGIFLNEGESTAEIAGLVLFGGIMMIIGGFICIATVTKNIKLKVLGILGGSLMLLGPLFFTIDLLLGISEIAGLTQNIVEVGSGTIFQGSHYEGYMAYKWGLWIGFYFAMISGVMGFAGGTIRFFKI